MQVPDVAKIEILGAQDEKIFVEFSMQQLAGLGIDRSALTAALAAQNIVSPSGILQTGNERLILRVSGAFESEQDILAVNFVANGRLIRLRDIAQVHRAYADPPQPMFRVNGKPAIGIAISMREGGDILTLGRNIEQAMREIRADLPLGIEPILVADQPFVVDHAIRDFTTSLWQAIAIIMAVSFVSLGVRAGAVIALSIPLTLAIVFPVMELTGIDLQRISLGALIIALGLLVDDAMTTVDVMTSRLAAGDSKEQAATFAYKTLALPMLTGSFVTAAGFIPIGFARSSAGEYTFSIFAVVAYALMSLGLSRLSLRRCSAWLLLSKPKTQAVGQTQPDPSLLSRVSSRRDAREVGHHRGDARWLCRGHSGKPVRAATVLSAVRSPGPSGRPLIAAKCLDLCQRRGGREARRPAQRRSRCGSVEHLCRPRRDSVLSSAQR